VAPGKNGNSFVAPPEPEVTTPSGPRDPGAQADAGAGSGPASSPRIDAGPDAGRAQAVVPALLSALTVEGGAKPMRPDFDPAVRRYSVIATERLDALRVTPKARTGLSIEVDGKRTDTGKNRSLTATPGTSIAVVVSNDAGESTSYSLVVLPPDFPDLVVTTLEPSASTDPIYVAMKSNTADYIAKLDAHAVPLFYRAVDAHSYDFKKHDNGELSYAIVVDDAAGADQVLLDENFDEIGKVRAQGLVNTDEHEFHVLPNGNYIVLSYEPAYRNMTAYGGMSYQRVDDGVLQELTPDLDVVFQWSSWGNLPYEEGLYGKRDYAHINSVFVDDDGNWLVSSRGMSQVLKIDRGTGDVIWRFGGMSGEFEFLDDPYSNLCGQHSVTRTSEGHLLMFDNGQHCWPENPDRGELTRVVEFELDQAKRTARLVWSYHRDDAYTYSQGSAQRLPNGNTFIGWGLGPTSLASEVDPDGNLVFDLEASEGAFSTYRAYRFAD
jgi:hypothetical protein